MAAADDLGQLPNLGPRSRAWLADAGITSLPALRRLGAAAAYVRVKQRQPAASLNLLWALEGALTGQHWQKVARDRRTHLLLALEDAQAAARGTPGLPPD